MVWFEVVVAAVTQWGTLLENKLNTFITQDPLRSAGESCQNTENLGALGCC